MIKQLFIFLCVVLSTNAFSQGTKKMVTNYSGRITNLKGVNSYYQDFSLVVQQNEVYFSSSRESNLVNYKENNWKKSGKVNVYKGDIDQLNDFYEVKVSNVQPFYTLRDEFTHVGPVCFTPSGDTMFFTKVPVKTIDRTIRVLRPQLFLLVKRNGIWNKNPQSLPFNNPLYSFAHPNYDAKTKTLYFVSDIKGGEGGKDIYSVSIKNGKWASPVNVKQVNSKHDELFPFVGEDNTIFFSSNRDDSKGGLDVYFKEENSSEAQNMEFLNSESDDFGVFLVKGKNIGFLSSNRNGSDDIYTFTFSKERNIRNSLFGKFKYRRLDESIERPLTVYLLNKNNEPIQETFVNENGEFEFYDLGLDEEYTIQAKSKAEMDLVLFDGEGNPDERLLADDADQFVYKMVDLKDVGSLNLTQVNEKGETVISGRFLYEDNPLEEPGELTVNLIDSYGKVTHTVESDKKGYFDFSSLPNDQDYIVKLEKENPDLTLIIFNQDGKVVERLKNDGNGFYLFRQLKVLTIHNIQEKNYLREEAFSFDSGLINGDFDRNGQNVEFSKDLIISVYNEKNELVDTIWSDKNGMFVYQKLVGIENYLFQLDRMGEDFDLSGITLKIIDDNGKLIKEILPQSDGAFQYRSLEILNIQALQSMNSLDEGDFDLLGGSSSSEIGGKIKYNDKGINLPEGLEISVFDENNEFQEKIRTNKNGDFSFKEIPNNTEYNFKITDKPDSMRISLFSIDINTKGAKPVSTILPALSGGFKYRKLDLLDNSLNLSSIDRLEESIDLIFDIKGNYDYDNAEGNYGEGLRVFAYDGNGNKIGEVMSDRFGNFVFHKLPGVSTVLFKIEGMDDSFDLDKFVLFIEGKEGKQLAKLRSSEKGFFVYKPLGFSSEIPLDIKEQMNEQDEIAIFGTNALDFSNEIESVYFGSNKTNPNKSDLLKIEKMLLLLEINPKSSVEINAYADSRASDNYNLLLSERRANWIKSYLTRKGISSDRIIINSYGEGKLVNDCRDGVDCPDKQHALNRRAEIRIFN